MQGITVGGWGVLEDEEWQEETFRYPYERGEGKIINKKRKKKKRKPTQTCCMTKLLSKQGECTPFCLIYHIYYF